MRGETLRDANSSPRLYTQFLIALIAVFFLWSEVGGQGHLDLMPWYLKLGLAREFAVCRGEGDGCGGGAGSGMEHPNPEMVGAMLALLVACGVVTYYYHLYGEDDQEDEQGTVDRGRA